MKIFKKLLFIFFLVISEILLYIFLTRIYATTSKNPNFFFFSCFMALAMQVIFVIAFRVGRFKIYNGFELFITSFCCFLVVVIFAIFGPVFIDRSISYHLAFYAVEKGSIRPDDFESQFSKSMFQKRINDAEMSGFISRAPENSFQPTPKAISFYHLMMILGKATNSLETYESTKNIKN